MIGKKINQLATELAPVSTDLTIIGDPISGVSKKITLAQLGAIFSGAVSFYDDLASFPATGDINVIYCAKDTKKLYLWSGSAYVEVFPSQALLDTYQLRSEKGVSNGYASLDSGGKVPISQLPSSIMEYKGMWNAATNTPTLANGTGDTGDVYICNVAGTVNFGAGPITFAVGDYVIYSGSIWQRSSGAVGTVTSVGLSITGDSIGVSNSPITTSGTLALAFSGTSGQYINGAGNLTTFPSLTGFVPYTGATTNVNLGTHSLLAYDLIIDHTSGSGVAASITKGGNGEALTVVKSSGTGNAASITGGVTLLDELHLNTDLADTYIASATNWNAAYNDKINSAAVTGTTTKTLTLTQQDGGTITASWTDDNTDAVTSVFGRTGAVVATSGDYNTSQVTENTNLYFTNARAIASTLTGYTSGAGTISATDTILSAIQKLNGNIGALTTGVSSVNGLTGAVTLTTSNIAEGTNLYYTEARVNANTNVAANTAARHNAVTIGTANGLSLSTQVLSLALASGSTTGALSSTDWTTFNNKQSALTNPVTGTGTTNYLPKFTGTSTIGNSAVIDDGTTVSLLSRALSGTSATFSGNITASGTGNIVIQAASSNNFPLFQLIDSRVGGTTWNIEGGRTLGNLQFRSSIAGATVLEITASGNLGLGVTPSAWVDYTGFQIGTQGSIGATSTVINFGQNVYYGASGNSYIANGNAAMYQINDGVHGWRIAGTGTAGNAISFTQAMTLTSNGNLLIGKTNNTGNKLQVSDGTNMFNVDYDANGPYLSSVNNQNTAYRRFTYDASEHYFNTSANTRLTIASTGAATFSSSVTAGAFIPSYNTSYFGTDGTISNYSATNYMYVNGTGGLRLKAEGVGYQKIVLEGGTSNDIWLTTSDTERMRITSGGSLLIGTSSAPSAIGVNDLLVIGKSGSASNAINFSNGSTTNWGYLLAESGKIVLGSGSSSSITFETNGGSERMRITSGGELLINTTSDAGDYKLQVNGNTYGVGNYYMNFNQDALTRLQIRNINTGSAAYVETTFDTANNSGAVGKLGPNISYKTSTANSTFLYNGASYGDISILNDNTNGKISMATGGSSSAQFTITSSGNVEATGSIKTGAPSGGTAQPWKLGTVYTGTCVPSDFGSFGSWFTGTVIEIEVNGTTYKIPAVIDNYC